MIRRVTLCGADQGLKSLRPLVLEIWATPFLKPTILEKNMKNLYFVRFLQVRYRFLGFLMQEIRCNYCFYARILNFRDMDHALFSDPQFLLKNETNYILSNFYKLDIVFYVFCIILSSL